MATGVKPQWAEDAFLVISPGTNHENGHYTVANGVIGVAELDLTDAHGAYLFIRVGRINQTSIAPGPKVMVHRRTAGGDFTHPLPVAEYEGEADAPVERYIISNASPGDRQLQLDDSAGFETGEVVRIGEVLINEEWGRIVRIDHDNNRIRLDRPIQFSHPGFDEHRVTNKNIVPAPLWLPGGSIYEILIDNDRTSSASIRAQLAVQKYTADEVVELEEE